MPPSQPPKLIANQLLKLSDFDYNLPPALIAQQPIELRDHSRLLVIQKNTEKLEHRHFFDIVQYLQPGDVLVINTSKVIKARGHKIIAVGTTSCRTVEVFQGKANEGWVNIFIYPGYHFNTIDALITNFHLPKTTLLMLVSALAGADLIKQAYAEAIKERYRFFSFGDAMMITPAFGLPLSHPGEEAGRKGVGLETGRDLNITTWFAI